MDERMGDCSSGDYANDVVKFGKSLKELRDLRSQLYDIADYCETAFCNSRNSRSIVEGTKNYVSQAVVTVVDHLGSMSATLELAISKSNSVPEAQCRIDILKQRIGICQQHSQKLALARLRWNAEFSRFHSRYIWLPLNGSSTMSSASRDSISCINANAQETHNRKKYLIQKSNIKTEDNKRVVPVHDGLQTLAKPEHSMFQLQMNRKPKHGLVKSKAVQNKDIAAAIIKRGKRILA